MADIHIRLEGDGIRRLQRAAERVGAKGDAEIKRGLISSGRKITTKVKRALVDQTGIKSRSVSGRVKDYFDASGPSWVITGSGSRVKLDEVKRVRSRNIVRDVDDQPRDAAGKFAAWPNPKLAAGAVTATMWGTSRQFGYSYKDRGRFLTRPPGLPVHQMFGPNVAKELVKDQSAQAFHLGLPMVEAEILKRIQKLSGGTIG